MLNGKTCYIGVIWDNGKENGSYYIIFRRYIGVIFKDSYEE